MTNVREFLLPDVGEGLTEAEIVSWLVGVGDNVEINQVIVEIETAKSVVELPSPFAGVVAKIHAEPGSTVEVGKPIISVAMPDKSTGGSSEDIEEPKLLVGYGAKDSHDRRQRRRPPTDAAAPAGPKPRSTRPRAKPPVRKLAKELGVNLDELVPTGDDDVITRDDVLRASAQDPDAQSSHLTASGAANSPLETRIPIKGVRKHTAAAMVASAFTAPHVTEFVTVDISAAMDLRSQLAKHVEFKDVRLSPLALVARSFLRAMKRTPSANSRWDEDAQEIVQMREVNLGIAAATPRGLIVPNIRSAQRLSLAQLAIAISDLADAARAGKTPPEAMSQGTVTISNFGVFGVDTGTPILNPGEAVILGVGNISRRPWVVDRDGEERLEARWVTTLALSFDHRIMDGREGSTLLADTANFLSEPSLFVL